MNKKRTIKKIILIIIGTFIMSISYNALFIPNKLLGGGVTGLAVLLHLVFNVDVSICNILLNIPIFILGYIFVDRKFVGYSLLGMFSLSFFLAVTSHFHIQTQDIFTTILLGGVLNGFGLGLVFKENGSCGGADIIAKILNKYFSISMATTTFVANAIVISMGLYFFNIDLAVHTLAAMFVSSRVVNYVVEGINHKKSILIITSKANEISKEILEKLDRGVTITHGYGAYTHSDKNILYCVIGLKQVAKVKYIVRKIDPKAFLTVTDTSAVFGNGRGFYDISND